MKYKKLVFLTSEFPYGKGETFIENEIFFLAPFFKDIVLFSQYKGTDKNHRKLPDNVSVELLKEEKSAFDFTGILRWPFMQEFLKNCKTNFLRNKIAIKSWMSAIRIFKAIKKHKSDHTIFYSYWLDNKSLALAMLKSKYSNVKVLSRAHGWDIYEERHLYNYLPFRAYLGRRLNNIYSISENGCKYLGNKGLSNVEVSRLGTLNSLEDSKDLESKNGFTVISVSNMIPLKRLDLIIEGLKIIEHEFDKLTWVHFGDGPLEEEMIDLSKQLKHVKIEFRGRVSNDILKKELRLLANNSVLINTSVTEGIPVSMMEAMSFKIPCIGTNVGGVAEIIETEFNGYLMAADPTPQQVANYIYEYFELSSSTKSMMCENAFQTWKEKYNAEKNYSEFINKITN